MLSKNNKDSESSAFALPRLLSWAVSELQHQQGQCSDTTLIFDSDLGAEMKAQIATAAEAFLRESASSDNDEYFFFWNQRKT